MGFRSVLKEFKTLVGGINSVNNVKQGTVVSGRNLCPVEEKGKLFTSCSGFLKRLDIKVSTNNNKKITSQNIVFFEAFKGKGYARRDGNCQQYLKLPCR